MEYENKETYKIPVSGITEIKLEKNEPFRSGENQYGHWYGYNIIVGSKDYTLFASPAVHELFQVSNIKNNELFNIEMRKEYNKNGDQVSRWYLNGKHKFQYQDDQDQVSQSVSPPSIVEKAPDPEPEPKPAAPSSAALDSKNKILEDLINQVDINLSNAKEILKKIKDESVVPF